MQANFELDQLGLSLIEQHADLFADIVRGIERESLRVTEAGVIAKTEHPKALGSALTHPFITTDFSEALIELVTPPVKGLDSLAAYLQSLHQFVYQQLDHEWLWPASMPPMVEEASQIKIAEYGKSNVAKMKQVYRNGLTHRYGKMMQVISGIHYNFSLPKDLFDLWNKASGSQCDLREFTDAAYFRLMRNYLKFYWLLIYLFGASPACAASSLPHEIPDYLQAWDKETYFAPYATSLRMSGLGYNNHSQASIWVSRDNVSQYAKDLLKTTQTPYEAYAKIGLKDEQGEYKQLNANLLQIENEYYSPIRPKQITKSGERPAVALMERGVEYIEVRCLDVNPFLPCGIDQEQAAFIDVFLVFCLLSSSESLCKADCQENGENVRKVVIEGRRPDLLLQYQGKSVAMTDWAESLFNQLEKIAVIMDAGTKSIYSEAVKVQREKISDSSLTPSAKMLLLMTSQQKNFQQLMLNQAKQYKAYFNNLPLPSNQQELAKMAKQSLISQLQIEAGDKLSFEQFIENYFRQGFFL
ncbi:MAG: gshA [Gammaproteobacteria bacterium]|jgi:glutamate--cysteine ligase|nr:gshA [Gammaproteobacteria bacterium]